ncbi:Hsp20/alpha crystallin family protein [Haloarchaeobius sp. HRN-SO-5]|uniref:Hsp20/alpha crystallin family protein n=1 Tax=Haloarchaeobius sp. HRN-SO-5 TaxID=3446118 RepID=UPI003EBF59D0
MAFRPYDDMNELFEQMDAMFDQMRQNWMGATPRLESGFETSVDRRDESATSLTEQDGAFVFVMDLPGFETEDIDLSYRDGYLHVDAATEVDTESEFVSMHQSRHTSERVYVPGDIVVEDIDARYRNGVLEVHLPIDERHDDTGRHIPIED